jgi:hypothetical protein
MDGITNMLNEAIGGGGGGGCSACSAQVGGARKLSAYQKFMKTEMKKLKASHPGKKAPEMMKMVAKRWKDVKPAPKSGTKSAAKSTRKSSTKKSSTRRTAKK